MIEDIRIRIQNFLYGNVSQKDLLTVCQIFSIPSSHISMDQLQRILLERVIHCNDINLLHQILYILGRSGPAPSVERPNNIINHLAGSVNNADLIVNHASQNNTVTRPSVNGTYNPNLYCINSETLMKCPIDVKSELLDISKTRNIFIPNFTRYPSSALVVPTSIPAYNNRSGYKTVSIPHISKNTVVRSPAFYCCQVLLHPLSLLIPKPLPDTNHQNRIMSKIQIYFTLSRNAYDLIVNNCSRLNGSANTLYKWQVILRFGVYDSIQPFPDINKDITELPESLPPYLTLWVNNASVKIWDILPSNTVSKEGKRHARGVNITEFLKFSSSNDQGYKQLINIHWWQTPGVFQYYYFGVFLERKIAVSEYLHRFSTRRHNIQKSLNFTLDLIREKFSSKPKIANDDDDDIVMSSVLPISLLCPVGKSRITCPLRSVSCQHLQCFDAELFLLMNERRSVWKCPVCDGQARIEELFVDEYFLLILKEFIDRIDVTEVNINSDGTYTPVLPKEDRNKDSHNHHQHHNGGGAGGGNMNNYSDSELGKDSMEALILLESDDDDDDVITVSEHNAPLNTSAKEEKVERVNMALPPIGPGKHMDLTIDLTSDNEESESLPPSRTSTPIRTPELPIPELMGARLLSSLMPVSAPATTCPHPVVAPVLISEANQQQQSYQFNPFASTESRSSFNNLTTPTTCFRPYMPSQLNPTLRPLFPTSRPIYPKIQVNNRILNTVNNSQQPQQLHQQRLQFSPLIAPGVPTNKSLIKNVVFMPCSSAQKDQNTSSIQSAVKDNLYKLIRPMTASASISVVRPPPPSTITLHSSINKRKQSELKRKYPCKFIPSASSVKSGNSSETSEINRRRSTRIQRLNRITYKESSPSSNNESSEDDDDFLTSKKPRRIVSDEDDGDSQSSTSTLSKNIKRLEPEVSGSIVTTSKESQSPPNNRDAIVLVDLLDPVVIESYLQQNECLLETDVEPRQQSLNSSSEENCPQASRDEKEVNTTEDPARDISAVSW